MKNVIVDGTTYMGVNTVQLQTPSGTPALFTDEDEAGGSITVGVVSGKVLHVSDAVPDGIKSLKVYDSAGNPFTNPVMLAIANKNLFRTDLMSNTTTKGITFTKQTDGSIKANGTSNDNYAKISVTLDKTIFRPGTVYTLSSGKMRGEAYAAIKLTYTDETTETFAAKNFFTVFEPAKAVSAAEASIEVAVAGTVVENEVIYPMLEIAGCPSLYEKNSFATFAYDLTTVPVLPDSVANIWSTASTVASMTMTYSQNVKLQADFLQSQNDANAATDLTLHYRTDSEYMVKDEMLVILSKSVYVKEEILVIS